MEMMNGNEPYVLIDDVNSLTSGEKKKLEAVKKKYKDNAEITLFYRPTMNMGCTTYAFVCANNTIVIEELTSEDSYENF